MGALAATLWLHDRRSALFTRLRVGKDGHPFRIYKFLRVTAVGAHVAALVGR
jgi:lipopolysaccharide/colanic/teichoic acid biosynthesis glycosyltransferase